MYRNKTNKTLKIKVCTSHSLLSKSNRNSAATIFINNNCTVGEREKEEIEKRWMEREGVLVELKTKIEMKFENCLKIKQLEPG